tara:strand:- start:203 stop:892 length:690 start_codon:yes stop_codon:yes gene_type:complete
MCGLFFHKPSLPYSSSVALPCLLTETIAPLLVISVLALITDYDTLERGRVLRVLFLLFAILPIVEIALLVHVGDIIGGWNTVGLVILSAFIGAYFVKREGINTLQTAQAKMQRNEMPGNELVEGLMLVVAGILLVTPGFITDIFGFLFALPGSRHFLAAQVSKHMKMRVVVPGSAGSAGGFNYQQGAQHNPFEQSNDPFGQRNSGRDDSDVIEGEFADKTQNDPDKRLK